MLNRFVSKKFLFDFNKKKFEIFDKELIPYLLGKAGNQTAINTAGSAWIKTIHRYKTERQEESVYRNPEYDKLLRLLNDCLLHKSDLFNSDDFKEINVKELVESTSPADKVLLGKFTRFREVMVKNLNRFKNDSAFRAEVAKLICNDNLTLKKNIPVEFTYIVLCLYIARKYSCFDKGKYASFILSIFKSKQEYVKKYYEALIDPSFKNINNLTCFCYTQYFWFDYRLSDSNDSAIHSILFGMFEELNIIPTTEITLDEIEKGKEIEFIEGKQEDTEFVYPVAEAVNSEYIELKIVDAKICTEEKKKGIKPRIIDFESENRRNKKLGNQGELIVYHKEKKFLDEKGKADLSAKVKHISKEDDTAGYDISSFELNSSPKLIEVKTTNSKPKAVSFFMSANEYNKAKMLKNYYIYIVFEAKTDNPTIWRIKDPFKFENKGLFLIPSKYRVLINTEV